ncbi:SpoIIE family protein phosphatase [Marinomonas sp. IMCC 4694]|uniref:SpoIIE family protein phosphatase n=1 Tax=Marinomonas sp. IMCC 4694 TaxID=2605432 RepID=UPI0011E82ECC|nr:SpoIIE family protein phosphatase [Marinomonas sp. IMCC 4694]TYL47560.1 SpoIIE family protein phosphatase [Marinomonas sp. IMCC 4694]
MSHDVFHTDHDAGILVQTLEQALDAVVCIDENNAVFFFNAAAEALWGYNRAEVLGENVNMLLPAAIRHHHDAYVDNNRATGVDKIVGTSRDVEFLSSKGNTIYAKLSISKIHYGDKILYTAFLKDKTYDVISRQDSVFLESIYEYSDNLIIGIDKNGVILHENIHFDKTYSDNGHKYKNFYDLLANSNNSDATIKRFSDSLKNNTTFIDDFSVGIDNPMVFSVHLQPINIGSFYSGHFVLNLKPMEPLDILYDNNEYHIVIVEDDLVFCALYADYFTRKSLTFTLLHSYQASVDYLSNPLNRFDVVILDNQLPDGCGLDLFDQFKKVNPYCGIIMVTGSEKSQFFIDAYDKGIDDFIRKPIVMDLLWIKCVRVLDKILTDSKLRQQKHQLEKKLEQEKIDQGLALHAFNSLFEMHNKFCPGLKSFISSESVFCGDNLLQAQASNGCWYFMLADAMGHGLAAATSLMPIVEPFYNMARGNAPLNKIVLKLNGLLERCLPDDRFVAATIVRLDPYNQEVSFWNGGMPAVNLYNHFNETTQQVVSSNLALGIFANDRLSINIETVDFSSFTHMLMHSDGLSETLQISGQFSIDDVKDVIDFDNIDTAFYELESSLKNKISMVHDDISIVLFDLNFFSLGDLTLSSEYVVSSESFAVDLDLNGSIIDVVDITHMLCSVLHSKNFHEKVVQKISLITTELISNAIEHGILDLDSTVKQTDGGFFTYYSDKAEKLQQLTMQSQLTFGFVFNAETKEICIKVKDSGAGFKFDKVTGDKDSFFGRGLTIVKELADRVQLNEQGNMISVYLYYR